MSLGDLIRGARTCSLRQLAKRVKVSHTYLSDVERGAKVPSDRVLKLLARALDLDECLAFASRPRLSREAMTWANENAGLITLLMSVGADGAHQALDAYLRRAPSAIK